MAKIFLDSGAFSAWANNTEINLQEYIDFIHLNKKQIETYACLDDITSPEKTWANQKEMEKQGLTPLPVYHTGEDKEYLKKAMSYDYFAIGGMALSSSVNRTIYFDELFSIICPKSNNFFPTHKVHGFGLASPDLLIKYPWYSADTTSWVQYGRFGIILIPAIKHGRIRYDIPPTTYTVSTRSKAVGDEKHFMNRGESTQKEIIKYCEDKGFKIGKTKFKNVSSDYILQDNEKWTDRKLKTRIEVIIEEGLCCNGEMRDNLNLEYFLDLEKKQPKWPWQFDQENLFD
jgi:hypothetical protein